MPARRPGSLETDPGEGGESFARHRVRELEVRDSNAGSETTATIATGALHLRFALATVERGGYVCLGVGRVLEKRADGQVVLDDAYIPPCLDCQASTRLAGFLTELQGLLQHRADELAVRITQPGRGGVAEVSDFLLLQLVNRWEPLHAHLAGVDGLHPESFYRVALELAGELATFTGQKRRPPAFPSYRHHALKETFTPLMAELRRSLSMVLEQNAIPIPIQEAKYGIRVAVPPDRQLYRTAVFVLAVNAQVAAEVIRSHFPSQVKIGPVEKIRDLVNLHLPGVGLRSLPVAPRQIPYHAGFSYFELDRAGELWKALETSGGCAIHIAGDYPGIELELGAIRG